MTWETIDRPGYFGSKRNKICAGFDLQYGSGNWKIAWEWGSQVIERPEAIQIYEDGYYEYFKKTPDLVNWLVNNFANVFDTAPSNVEAKFSYDIQETPSNHLHDVAIRRALLRNGKWFRGVGLLEVRSPDKEGWILSPCNIPFHLPTMIYPGQTKYQCEERDFVVNPPWWIRKGLKNSVEEFYQQNKLLQIK
ncbi:hypothetical protein KA107_03130 [Candidatus Pacearchaeota archaeon]|nr:hypothetical protein [Candidatus Pacearchaeota archaeon]